MKLRLIILVLALLSFLSTSVGGYLYYSSLKKSALEEAHREAEALAKRIAGNIDSYLSEHKKSVKILAGLDMIQQALVSKDAGALEKANLILDFFHNALGVSVCYMIDNNGNTIASSNRNASSSFVGKNYSFRPYFQEAIHGNPYIYIALGVTSGKRGVYYSHPVYGKEKDTPSGVVVIKASIDYIEKEINQAFEGIMLLSDPRGVVFVSNRKDWLYHVLWKVSAEEISGIAKTRQFGKGPWNWTGLERKDEQFVFDKSGKEYHVNQIRINNYKGWNIFFLHDYKEVARKVGAPLFRTAGYIILSSCLLIGLSVAFLYRKASYDIIQRKKAEEALREEEERFRAVAETASDAIVSMDSHEKISFWNSAAETIFGYSADEIAGKSIALIIPKQFHEAHQKGLCRTVNLPADKAGHQKELIDLGDIPPQPHVKKAIHPIAQQRASWPNFIKKSNITESTVELCGLRKDGSKFPIELSVSSWRIKEDIFFTAIIRDITERKRFEEKLRELSEIDPLTNIYNRRMFFNFLEAEVNRAKRYKKELSLIMFDIDDFKKVNDLYGHDVGDYVLKTAVEIVKKTLRKTDLLARYGGEEFLIISPETSIEGVKTLAEKVRAVIDKNNFGKIKKITISLGVTVFKENDTLHSFIKRVDKALYMAKNKGRNRLEILL